MANRTIQTAQLTPNATFAVRGKLSYARIASQISGQELQNDIRRRQARGWIPTTRPYTTATVCNAQVVVPDPQHMTPEQQYAQESLYTSTSNPGLMYTAKNTGKFLPWVGVLSADHKSVDQIIPEGELARDLDVTLVMRVFQGKPNKGITLDGIIVNEPIRYFNSAAAGQGVSELGLDFHPVNGGALQVAANAPVAENTPPIEEPEPATNYAAPQEDPYSSQPAQQAQMPANPLPYGNSGNNNNGGGIVNGGNSPMQFNPQGNNRNY